MRTLGANADTLGGNLEVSAEELIGNDIFLDMPSVGATVNSMLTAVNASGTTCIHNAAKEPHIVDLANFLSAMGAWVKGAGTDVIRVRGGPSSARSQLYHHSRSDRDGNVDDRRRGHLWRRGHHRAIPAHMEALSAKLLEMGVCVESEDDWIHVRSNGVFRPVNVKRRVIPVIRRIFSSRFRALLTWRGHQHRHGDDL